VELAALAANGDRTAFGELVRRHGAAVRGLLRRMGAEAALADDLAQDAFLTAYEQIADFRGEGAFHAWVRRIAARLYIKRHRKDHGGDLIPEPPEPATLASAAIAPPSEIAELGPLDLDQALGQLSAAERLCIGLCYGAGFSHNEAAEALNAPLGRVKSQIKRGLDKLQSRLAAGDGGDLAGARSHG